MECLNTGERNHEFVDILGQGLGHYCKACLRASWHARESSPKALV